VDKATTILIVDDDTKLSAAICLYLSKNGYQVLCASDGLNGLQQLYNYHPDLIILDIMMPNMNGWETCRRIREISDIPIIMLTARGQEVDKITGFSLGADDYLAKPFSMKELSARIEAILRRAQPSRIDQNRLIFVGPDLTIDMGHWEVRRKGALVELTSTEMRMLFYLAEHANQVLTHRQILEHVWGAEYIDEVDYTKLFIWRLRQKIEDDPKNPQYLLTERGVGYRFRTRL